MSRGKAYANYPFQLDYTLGAACYLLGWHRSTGFRHKQDGSLKTVPTPVGERIGREEIARQRGTTIEEELARYTPRQRGEVISLEAPSPEPVATDDVVARARQQLEAIPGTGTKNAGS